MALANITNNILTDSGILVTNLTPTTRTLTINGVTYDLSADRSWTIATHDAVTIGTANGLSLSGQVLSLGLASGSANGALSSTDWTTFNNKQNALTNPVTGTGTSNYIPKWTSSSSIGNSDLITDASGNLSIAQGNNPTQALNLYKAGSTQTVMAVGNSNTGLNGTYFGVDANGNGIMNTTGAFANIFSTNGSERMRLNASGNLSIGNTNDTYKLDVTGTGRFSGAVTIGASNFLSTTNLGTSAAYMTIQNSGGTTYIGRENSTGTNFGATAYSTFIFSGGAYPLEFFTNGTKQLSIASTGAATFSSSVTAGGTIVAGTSATEGTIHFGTGVYKGIMNYSAATGTWTLNNQSSGSGPTLYYQFQADGSSIMSMLKSGNVGIGNTNPGSYNAGGNNLVVGNLSGFTGITISSGSSQEGSINFADGLTGNQLYRGAIAYSHLSDAMWFYTSGGEKMRITSGGNVGIGTTSPSTKLHIGGVGSAISFDTTGATATSVIQTILDYELSIKNNRGTSSEIIVGNEVLSFKTNSAERMRITSGGNLLVGTTIDSGHRLQISGNIKVGDGGGASLINFNASSYGALQIGGSTKLTVNTGISVGGSYGTTAAPSDGMIIEGNVGIGTTSPSSILHVVGSGIVNIVQSSNTVSYTQYYNSSTGTSANDGLTVGVNGTDAFIFQREAANLILGTSDAERMRITSSGTLLVGTTTEGFLGKLQVAGSVAITGQYNTVLPSSSFSYFDGSGQVVSSASSASALYLDTTWNTTGNPDGIYLNVTNTASGSSSKLLNLKVGSVSQFSVSKGGAIQTSDPTNGTARPWKLGDARSGGISTDSYIIVEVNGVTYSIPALNGLP